MAYGKKKFSKRPSKKSTGFAAKTSNGGLSTQNRDNRFKQINQYKVKPEPFPRVLYTRMKYGEQRTLSCSLGLASGITYRANSIYDPNFSVGAGSRTTVGHDQMANLYNRYLVTGCKIYVTFNNPNTDGLRVGVRLRMGVQNQAQSNTIQDIAEKPMTYVSGINDSGRQTKSFSLFIRPWTLRGLSKLEYMANTTKYSSDINASPAQDDTSFFDVFAIQPNATIDSTVQYMIRVVYYVQLYDRIGLQSSLF